MEWSELWDHYEGLVKSKPPQHQQRQQHQQHQQHQQNQQRQQHQQNQQRQQRQQLNGTSIADSEMSYYQTLPSTFGALASTSALFLNLDHTECSNLARLCSFNPMMEWAGE